MAKAKGPRKGTGGHGRRRLEGKGPTPKAEDRVYHKAHKEKLERQRRQQGKQNSRRFKGEQGVDTVAGRNSVLEALREGVPAKALYIVRGADSDDRVRDAIAIAADRGVPLLEASRDELDRMTDRAVHQDSLLSCHRTSTQPRRTCWTRLPRKCRSRCWWPSTASPTPATSGPSSALPQLSAVTV